MRAAADLVAEPVQQAGRRGGVTGGGGGVSGAGGPCHLAHDVLQPELPVGQGVGEAVHLGVAGG